MHRKVLQVQVELDVQAITCPGVYLCPNGQVSLQLYMLDSCIQTNSAEPIFPILCHEKFIFYKTFYSAQTLTELQKSLRKEYIYVELIQWQNCEIGNVLASFQSSLSEVLYPTIHEGAVAGVDIDLLMDAAPNFPGVIAPKVEVCTRTVIEDTLYDGKKCESFVVNPKVIQSTGGSMRNNPRHQRKVCHSAMYHRSRKCFPKMRKMGRPPFLYRKVADDLLERKPQGLGPNNKGKLCRLCSNKQLGESLNFPRSDVRETDDKLPKLIEGTHWPKFTAHSKASEYLWNNNNNGHRHEQCPVCSKYKYYFDSTCSAFPQIIKDNNCNMKRFYPVPKARVQTNRCMHDGLSSTRTSRVIRCFPTTDTDFPSPPVPKLSLAEKLHRRLIRTLGSCDYNCERCPLENFDTETFTTHSQQASPTSELDTFDFDCSNLNMDDFYRNFYRHTKRKCNHIFTPCCT